jgi:hypothetical protein
VSDIRIDTAENLEMFLKILAEESVKKSRDTISDSRVLEVNLDTKYSESDYQSEIASQIKKDTMRFSEADEDEESVLPSEEEQGQDDSDQEADPAPETMDEPVDFYTIRGELNKIRAGESLREPEIGDALEKYVMDTLDPDEREVLHTFVKSIANIMNRTGQQPKDPSEPPTSIDIKKSGEESKTKPEAKPSSDKKPEQSASPKKGEDITPPIQVGGQVKEALRKKVLELMKG